MDRVHTNIVMFAVTDPALTNQKLIALAADRGVRLAELGRGQIRAVTHRGVSDDDIDHALTTVGDLLPAPEPCGTPAQLLGSGVRQEALGLRPM